MGISHPPSVSELMAYEWDRTRLVEARAAVQATPTTVLSVARKKLALERLDADIAHLEALHAAWEHTH